MATTTTWQINTCERELADGYVRKVIYRVLCSDGTYNSTGTGEVVLEKPETLIPYKDLTEATVIGWIKAKLDADNAGTVAAIEKAIEEQINIQKTPTHGVGKPRG